MEEYAVYFSRHGKPDRLELLLSDINAIQRGKWLPGYDAHKLVSGAGRLPETRGPGARLEHRICGADVNPYLALAAISGGILHGLKTEPELPLPLDDPATEPTKPLGHDWRNAVDVFAESDFIADLFDTEYRDIYAMIRYDEVEALTSAIAPVEYRYYLGRL